MRHYEYYYYYDYCDVSLRETISLVRTFDGAAVVPPGVVGAGPSFSSTPYSDKPSPLSPTVSST